MDFNDKEFRKKNIKNIRIKLDEIISFIDGIGTNMDCEKELENAKNLRILIFNHIIFLEKELNKKRI